MPNGILKNGEKFTLPERGDKYDNLTVEIILQGKRGYVVRIVGEKKLFFLHHSRFITREEWEEMATWAEYARRHNL